jgi:hypothetical protein
MGASAWWRGDVEAWTALLRDEEPAAWWQQVAAWLRLPHQPPPALVRASRVTAPVAWQPGAREAKVVDLGRRYLSWVLAQTGAEESYQSARRAGWIRGRTSAGGPQLRAVTRDSGAAARVMGGTRGSRVAERPDTAGGARAAG